jgi:hypothetical protein
MNDPLEDQLRQLRPGPLPVRLRARLAAPPEDEKILRFPWWKVAAGLAAAACVMLLAWFQHSAPQAEKVALIVAETPAGEVIGARKMGVVTDGGQRAWEMTELDRLEGQTFAADVSGMTVLTQRIRHELVQVEIHFD